MTPSGVSSDPVHVSVDTSAGTLTVNDAAVSGVTATTTAKTVAATTTSAAVLASNASAVFRLIVNAGTDGVTLKLGSGAVTDYVGIFMPANSVWDGWIGKRFWTGDIAVKALTSTATLSVVEG